MLRTTGTQVGRRGHRHGTQATTPPHREDSVQRNPANAGQSLIVAGEGAAPKRVLLIASAGGHWIELCRLSAALADCDCQFVSTSHLVAPAGCREVLQITDSSRDTMRSMMRTMMELLPIVRRFKPDFVISTGAAPGALGLLAGKMLGARTIWIDSMANSERLSLSGRVVRLVADLCVTQWEHLARKNSAVEYFGQVL